MRTDLYDERFELPATPARVMAILEDIPAWPTWANGVSKAFRSRNWTTLRVGARFGFVPKFLHLPIVVAVLEYEPERRLVWGTRTPLGSIAHGLELSPAGDGRCQVHHYEQAKGLLSLSTRLLARQIEAFDRELTRDLQARVATDR